MKLVTSLNFVLKLVGKFIVSFIRAGLNERNVFQVAFNFALNFSPVFIWLCIFKNAGRIPNEIRPKIYVSLIYNLDIAIFEITAVNIILWCLCTLAFSVVWYKIVKLFANKYNKNIYTNMMRCKTEAYELQSPSSGSSISSANSEDDEEEEEEEEEEDYSIGEADLNNVIDFSKISRTYTLYLTPIVFFSIWPLLNLAYYLREPLATMKDLTAWFFYVLGHITFPILTAVWLYVFHPQGVVKMFSCALGLQNIAGVSTHLLFPNAPPWFIHLYGPNAPADYDMPGYAAGLTRVDLALGTHLNSNGFHKSPIVFGAFPSLHSAMAVQVFLFVFYFSRSVLLRILAFSFVLMQWWGTIYLDHHFKIDLLAGLCYALITFMLLYPIIRRKELNFINNRIVGNFAKSSTFGMRVFENAPNIRKFFDPLQ